MSYKIEVGQAPPDDRVAHDSHKCDSKPRPNPTIRTTCIKRPEEIREQDRDSRHDHAGAEVLELRPRSATGYSPPANKDGERCDPDSSDRAGKNLVERP